jgi:polar amino acid transport system substrate-binding protein
VVGTDAAYAPFESQNEKGEIVGFDIEVVQAIAKKAGIEVKGAKLAQRQEAR